MSSRRVLLPQPIEPEAMALLKQAGCEIVLAPDPKPETVAPLMKGVQGLILRTGIKITRELLTHADDLMIVARTGGGVDNVDLEAATDNEVIVTSNLGVNTISVVEQVLSFTLTLFKQLRLMDQAVRQGNFGVRYKNLPRDLGGNTLGVIGFGRIGSTLARVCSQTFHMKIVAHDPYLPDQVKAQYESWAPFTDLKTLLSDSDVVSIHIPLTDDTRGLIGARELSWMKPEALLINTSRGGLIDENALAEALREGKLGGAGLDVFNQEPVPADNPLLSLDNVICTPHSAALTRECVIRMATEAAERVIDVFNGVQPVNIANPQVLQTEKWKSLSSPVGS